MWRPKSAAIIKLVSVVCGIAGWVDKSLMDSKLFYPLAVKTSGDRLRFYASQFSLVEVDSTYYGIPKPDNAEAWAAQTPAGFTFDVKSFSLFTNHPTRPVSLPPDIREQLPADRREKNVYLEHMPDELLDEAWDRFQAAIEPLRAAGKLGAVFFQFPPWFLPSSRSLAFQRLQGVLSMTVATEDFGRNLVSPLHAVGIAAPARALIAEIDACLIKYEEAKR